VTGIDPGKIQGHISALELQKLLHYVVREKKFFEIKQDQSYGPPGMGKMSGHLRVQADGKDHTVAYSGLFEGGNPATEEGKRLNDILARIAPLARATAPAAVPKPAEDTKPPKASAVEATTPVWTVLDPHELKAARGTTLTKLLWTSPSWPAAPIRSTRITRSRRTPRSAKTNRVDTSMSRSYSGINQHATVLLIRLNASMTDQAPVDPRV